MINNISTANTFEQWLTTTQSLVSASNALTDGPSVTANTNLDISGTRASLNVRTSSSINTLYANTGLVTELTSSNVTVTGNVTTLNVTNSSTIGGNEIVYGNLTVYGTFSAVTQTAIEQSALAYAIALG
jgi:hypothetical protein